MPFAIEELISSKYFITILGVILFYFMHRLSTRKRRYFSKYGRPMVATILSIHETGFSKGNYDKIYEMKLEVENEDKTTRVVITRNDYDYRADKVPQPGNQIDILVDSKNPDRVMITPKWYRPRQN